MLTSRANCSNINRLKECLFAPIVDECGPEAVDMIKRLIETLVGSLLSLPCRRYDPSEAQCVSLLPKPGLKASSEYPSSDSGGNPNPGGRSNNSTNRRTNPPAGRNTSALSKIISTLTNIPSDS